MADHLDWHGKPLKKGGEMEKALDELKTPTQAGFRRARDQETVGVHPRPTSGRQDGGPFLQTE